MTNGVKNDASQCFGRTKRDKGDAILAILRAISDHPWSIGRLLVTISCRFVEH